MGGKKNKVGRPKLKSEGGSKGGGKKHRWGSKKQKNRNIKRIKRNRITSDKSPWGLNLVGGPTVRGGRVLKTPGSSN